jgi:undecaprenyl-phosphate 4-deoxy-4-formamido-L-arabinose transferase
MTRRSSLSIVIPVFNSQASLEELCSRLSRVLPELSGQFELILVNDGSRDNSWTAIENLLSRYQWIRGLNLMRNYGQHNAVLCGIRAAKHEVIVTIDDDLQHPPGEISKLLDKLNEGYDVVYGMPEKEQHGVWRSAASLATKWALQAAMGVEIARQVSAFRAFRTQLRDAFSNYGSPFVSIDVLLTWGTTRFAAVSVSHQSRQVGPSNYTLQMLVAHAMNMMTGFSTLPLQISSLIGFVFTLFGLCVLLYVIGRYLIQGDSVPGFPFLASIIAIFSGAQLFALGIIGEYLARMHLRTIERPPYVVRADPENGKSGEAR